MRSSLVVYDLAVNADIKPVPGSSPASSDTVESEGRKIKHS